ncbi:MAG TPA: hypothetical protein VI172_14085 [Candidatus Dormibacteraeota bacterium]|jgi:hypothetical protein
MTSDLHTKRSAEIVKTEPELMREKPVKHYGRWLAFYLILGLPLLFALAALTGYNTP